MIKKIDPNINDNKKYINTKIYAYKMELNRWIELNLFD